MICARLASRWPFFKSCYFPLPPLSLSVTFSSLLFCEWWNVYGKPRSNTETTFMPTLSIKNKGKRNAQPTIGAVWGIFVVSQKRFPWTTTDGWFLLSQTGSGTEIKYVAHHKPDGSSKKYRKWNYKLLGLPSSMQKMETPSTNSCVKTLWCRVRSPCIPRRWSPPWYYSLRQVKCGSLWEYLETGSTICLVSIWLHGCPCGK